MSARIWSPSQLLRRKLPPGQLCIAGRVVRANTKSASKESIVLADALGSITLLLRESIAVEPWDVLLVTARQSAQGLLLTRVVEQRPASAAPHEFERLHSLGVGKALQARAAALTLIRRYLDEHGFVEVQTPTWVTAPGTDVYIDPVPSEDGYLITSPEFQMKRLLAGGMPKIYQLAQVFRKGEQGALHEREFSMLEWYRANDSYQATMKDTEIIVSRIIKALSGGNTLKTAQGPAKANRPGNKTIVCTAPFDRVTVRQAFKKYAGIADVADLAASDEDRYFDLLVSKVEPALAQRKKPVFLLDYPLSQAALARPCPHAPGYAERFELYLGGVELCNGYGELTDASEQRARFVADNQKRRANRQSPLPLDEKFLSALEQGLPPCSGNALGLDRLIMLALGAPAIERVMAFPRICL